MQTRLKTALSSLAGLSLLALSLGPGTPARAALLVYEPFTNAPGNAIIGSSGGAGFTGAWEANGSGGTATNTGFGLGYTDATGNTLAAAGGAGFFQGLTTANTSMQPVRLFGFSRGTNGTDGLSTWISFLMIRQGPTNGSVSNPYLRGANIAHDLNGSSVSGTNQKLAVGNSSGAAANTVGLIPYGQAANLQSSAVPFSQTNLVVVRVDHVAGASDNAYLFVNPNLANEPALNTANASSIAGFDFSMDRVRVFVGGQSSAAQPYAEIVLDEYRVGETFADVAPHSAGTSQPPVVGIIITNTTLVSGNIMLSGAGGTPNQPCHLLATTNDSLIGSGWLSVATNAFNASGGFRISNPVTPGLSAQFFRVRAGTNPVTPPQPAHYYVSPTGNDSNSGTNIDHPFATLARAAGLANPGHLIYLRGGAYSWSSQVGLSRSGTAAQTIRVFAYPGETPVINFSGSSTGTRGISISGNCWHLRGLEIAYAGDNGIYIGGKSNTVERCVLHDNEDSGLQLANYGSAYNLILNCDSYRNYDVTTHGENADGFAAKFDLGPGNVFSGCRAWENSDDGWDLWQATNSVVLTNCWTWRNGTNAWGDTAFAGDGNGIKIGGNYYYGPHYVYRCVSFRNPGAGFDQNNNNAGQTLYNNTAWANGGRNFNLNHGTNITPHVVCNNLSIAGGSSDSLRTGTLATNNSWQVLSPAASTSDVLSVIESLAASPRQSDGSLPVTNFLRPVPGGRLVDAGVDVGMPFNGTAPDLGAFEAGP